ncbi:restriction endonuclease subunit S [Vibrio splendidus]
MGNKVKLGELLEVLTDYHANGAYKKLKENVELLDSPDYAVMIRTTNFEQSNFSDSLKFITKHAYDFLAKSKVYPNDIIMNKIANAGSSYLMPDLGRPVSLAMNLFLLRVDAEKVNPRYLYLFLKINEAYVKSFANGSVTKTITKEAVRNLDIELPSRLIQDKIVKQFSDINEKITLNNQINQTLEQMAQTLFKSWFVDFDPVKAKMNGEQPKGMDAPFLSKEVASLFPEKLVESELGLIPEGWEVMGLPSGTLFREGPGILAKDFHEKGVPLIRLAGLKNGVSLLDGCNYLDPEKVDKKWKHFLLQEGDILLSSSASLGRVAEVTKQSENSIAYTGIIGFRPIEGVTTRKYLKYFIQSRNFQRQIEAFGVGSVLKHFGPTHLKKMWILLPPVSIQDKFEQLVLALDEKIQTGLEQNQSLSNLRDTLLPKLLSGEIDLENLQVEQAKALAE